MSTYIAITTTNARVGWKVIAYGSDSKSVADKAHQIIGDPAGITPGSVLDIYTETEHKNLRVVSKTLAMKFGIDYDDSESFVRNFNDAVQVK